MQYLCILYIYSNVYTHVGNMSTHPLWNQLERQLIAKPCYGIRHQFIRVLIAILLNTYNYTIFGIYIVVGGDTAAPEVATHFDRTRIESFTKTINGYNTHTMRDYGRNMCPQNYFRSDRIMYSKFIPRGKKGHIYPAILAIATTVSTI